MRHFIRFAGPRPELLMVVAILLTVVLAACNNGSQPAY
jgi:hypothetical protein